MNYALRNPNKEVVLCQLTGPLAIADDGTRNGTNYTSQVWEAIERGENFQEMIENGSFYIGCDHPEVATRSSLVSLYQQTAGIVSQYTRDSITGIITIIVDILDTPLGRIIATIAKYGSFIGISTRMHGDVIPGSGGKVDPESVDFLGADFVTQPSQKASRLKLVLNEGTGRKIKLTELEIKGAIELLESSGQREVIKDIRKEYKGGNSMLGLVGGKVNNARLLEGFNSLAGEKIGASGYLEDRFGIEHEIMSIKASDGLLEMVLHGGEFSYFKPTKAGLLEAVLGKKGKGNLLEGISVGSDPSVNARIAPMKAVSVNDINFEDVMTKIEEVLGKVAAKSMRSIISAGPNSVGSITVGSDNSILVEGKKGSSVIIKGKQLTAIQGRDIVETAMMEGKDSLDHCVKTLLSDYAVRTK